MEDHLKVVLMLLEFGADALAKDMLHNEWNSLHFAIMQVTLDIIHHIHCEIQQAHCLIIYILSFLFIFRIMWKQ